jgi:hypothetical protein
VSQFEISDRDSKLRHYRKGGITSASVGLNEEARCAQPLAGGLFALPTDVTGVACRFYAG